MRQRVLGLRDADRKMRGLGIRLERRQLLFRKRLEIDAVAAVDFLDLLLDAVLERIVEIAQIGEVVQALITASASSNAPSPPFSQWSDTANVAPACSATRRTRSRSACVSV